MQKLVNFEHARVFKYFEEISRIPRGSGNMGKISEYCMEFAKSHSLKAIRDEANNVIIFKDGTKGYENSEPVILQGHLDMVCQKENTLNFDFEKDSIDIYFDGEFIKAKGTTLGADNGIAVAMVLSILESDLIEHPPIEAVFTTDEEIGMLGALRLSLDRLKGRRMINIDSDDPKVITVSCAGGSDFKMTIPVKREKVSGKKIVLTIKGLKGGHSGVEINNGRVNANILMSRILNFAENTGEFAIISVNGGDKGNAIPLCSVAEIVSTESETLAEKIKEYAADIKKEIDDRENGFNLEVEIKEEGSFDALTSDLKDKIIYMLLCAPNGVIEMSAEIENLVETSLNLGVLKTEENKITVLFTLRSNKQSALDFLEEKLRVFSKCIDCQIETGGHYPPWEFNGKSELKKIYIEKFKDKFGYEPKVEAIHAGLECGIFSSGIRGLDCISVGPEMIDIHTTRERLSVSSTKDIYEIILNVLKECK